MMGPSAALLLLLGLGGVQHPRPAGNVLILIADDLGVDRVGAYGHRNGGGEKIAPSTPSMDALAESGVLFRNAWAAPLCSPSRAMALTGKYPNKIGVGRFIPNNSPDIPGLDPDLFCIPDLLPEGYLSAAIGKWHIATQGTGGQPRKGTDHPVLCGFDAFRGTQGNLQTGRQSYTDFDWIAANKGDLENRSRQRVTDAYVTSFTTDQALDAIQEFGERPWLLWVAYHAPHRPLHVPPADLVASKDLDLSTRRGKGKAMIEALDFEIGRLLAGIDGEIMEHTTVIFFGDNGTQRDLIEPPFDVQRGKGTVYNNGVNVPFIVAGGSLPAESRGLESHALVDLTDLLPTVADLVGGVAPAGIDGESFMGSLIAPEDTGARDWIFAERFAPNFDPSDGVKFADRKLTHYYSTIRDGRFKLVWIRRDLKSGLGTESLELYDLQRDFHEQTNLMDGEGMPPSAYQEDFKRLYSLLREQSS